MLKCWCVDVCLFGFWVFFFGGPDNFREVDRVCEEDSSSLERFIFYVKPAPPSRKLRGFVLVDVLGTTLGCGVHGEVVGLLKGLLAFPKGSLD